MNPVVRYGALAGLLPFLGAALAWYFNWLTLEPFLRYSAIIVSFLSGVLWWFALSAESVPVSPDTDTSTDTTTPPDSRFSLGVALAIPAAAWLAWFIPERRQVLVLGALFLLVWVWEMLALRHAYRRSYLLLRTGLTLIVVLVHAGIWATL